MEPSKLFRSCYSYKHVVIPTSHEHPLFSLKSSKTSPSDSKELRSARANLKAALVAEKKDLTNSYLSACHTSRSKRLLASCQFE